MIQLVRQMTQWRSVSAVRRWIPCGAARPDPPSRVNIPANIPRTASDSRTCSFSFPGPMPLRHLSYLTPGMPLTQQQKKYFSSVFNDDKRRKILKGQRFTAASEEGCIYVDKTPLIKRLVKMSNRGTGAFVNRPRGFGKSLLVSTLEEYFKGNKEAFRGTAIYNDPEVKWEKWPVIKFDMSRLEGSTLEEIESSLVNLLFDIAEDKGVEIPTYGLQPTPVSTFRRLLNKIYDKEGKELIVLVDEYDSPIVSNWVEGKGKLAAECECLLWRFYRQLGSASGIIRLHFLTGISRLPQGSLRCRLTDLIHIDNDPHLGAILGFTREEVKSTYSPEIEVTAKELKMTEDELLDKVTQYYDGYNWNDDNLPACQVHNPYSINEFFTRKEFLPYSTDWPTLLRRAADSFDFVCFADLLSGEAPYSNRCGPDGFFSMQKPYVYDGKIRFLLWDYGILRRRRSAEKGLGIPFTNEEVREHFPQHVAHCYGNQSISKDMSIMLMALLNRDIHIFAEAFATLVENIPADDTKWKDRGKDEAMRRKERFYEPMYVAALQLFASNSSYVGSREVLKGNVRPDLVFISPECAMVFEFEKDPERADEGLERIEEKEYIPKYGEYLKMKVREARNNEESQEWGETLKKWESVPKWGIGINVSLDEKKKMVTKATSMAKKFPF